MPVTTRMAIVYKCNLKYFTYGNKGLFTFVKYIF